MHNFYQKIRRKIIRIRVFPQAQRIAAEDDLNYWIKFPPRIVRLHHYGLWWELRTSIHGKRMVYRAPFWNTDCWKVVTWVRQIITQYGQ